MRHTTGWTNALSHKYTAAQRRGVPVFTRGVRTRRRPMCELCIEPQA